MLFEIKDYKEVMTPELLTIGQWMVASIETNMPWPTKPQSFKFASQTLWVMPVTNDCQPGIAINRPSDLSKDDAEIILYRALSSISWIRSEGIVVTGVTGGTYPRAMGLRDKFRGSICAEYDFANLPEPSDSRAQIALALMREARALNHVAYSFLSYFRVVEHVFKDGKKRAAWIASNIGNVTERISHGYIQAMAALISSNVQDIGKHLWESGRCAIAHAGVTPIVDPDDPRDMRRLRSELPLMRGLAILAIESELGVETSSTIYHKHLYELAGFKEIIGAEIVDKILAGAPLDSGMMVDCPEIDIRLRRHTPYGPLMNMTPVHMRLLGSSIELTFESQDKLVTFQMVLDFPSERLCFNFEKGLVAVDDGTEAAARVFAELCRFNRDYLLNGELQIFDTKKDRLIARKEAFVPVNMRINREFCDAQITRWQAEIEKRRLVCS